MIERSTLMEMFQVVESQGLSTKQELLWGYFFIDKDPEKLQAMVPELEQAGYSIVDLYEPGEGPEDDDEGECDDPDHHHDHGCEHEHKHEHKHAEGTSDCGHEHGHSHKHECGLEHEHAHQHEHKHEAGHDSHEHKHECGHEHGHEHEHKHESDHEHEHSHDEHCDHEHDEDEEDDDEYYCLHIEKAEQHTVDSLDARNKEFAALATKYGIEGYDGMDVGPVDGDDFETDEHHEHGAGCNH